MRPSVVKVIGDIVDKVSLAYAGEADKIYFYHAHPIELAETLLQKGKLKLKKYPAIFLYEDIKEHHTSWNTKADIRMLILTETKPTYSSADRDLNIYEPILLPIFELLMDELNNSTLISNANLEYDKYNRKFWGSSQANKSIANDYIDAIEITNLTIEIPYRCVQS